jgi:hypothetical protein
MAKPKFAGTTRPAGKRGRPSNAERAAMLKASIKTNETPQERVARIGERFNVMYKLTKGSIQGSLRSLVVSGAPGCGKSHTILSLLEQAKDRGDITFHKVSGTVSAINLYKLLWRNSGQNQIVVLDDTDSIYDDEDALNLLKAALDTSERRMISWLSESNVLKAEDIETEFEYKGSMIFITNRHLQAEIEFGRSKLITHYKAMIDRSVYLDLKLHDIDDVVAWVSYMTLKQHILVQRGLSREQELDVVKWVQTNVDQLASLSIRTMIKVGDFMLTNPAEWESFCRVTLLK